MAVISFMTTKGGGAKTTSCSILAGVLVEKGGSVCIIDADPNQPLVEWASAGNLPDKLMVVGGVNEDNIIETIEEQSKKNMFVLVDLEGSANLSTGYALSQSDLILIPLQPSVLDANEAAKTIKFILRQAKTSGKKIEKRVFWARVPAAYTTRSGREIGKQFIDAGIAFLNSAIVDREAYKGIFGYKKTLQQLTEAQVPSLQKAQSNAISFTKEVVDILKEIKNVKR